MSHLFGKKKKTLSVLQGLCLAVAVLCIPMGVRAEETLARSRTILAISKGLAPAVVIRTARVIVKALAAAADRAPEIMEGQYSLQMQETSLL